eukprot:11994626-Karenia_brevis.AAC.1
MVKQIHAVIFRVHVAAQELKKTPSIQSLHSQLAVGVNVQHVAPLVQQELIFRILTHKISLPIKDAYLAKSPPVIKGFAQLLSHVHIAVPHQCPGLTWIE